MKASSLGTGFLTAKTKHILFYPKNKKKKKKDFGNLISCILAQQFAHLRVRCSR